MGFFNDFISFFLQNKKTFLHVQYEKQSYFITCIEMNLMQVIYRLGTQKVFLQVHELLRYNEFWCKNDKIKCSVCKCVKKIKCKFLSW